MRKIGVVVLTYNNGQMLRKLLEEVFGQSYKADEVIVIDNASIDDTREVAGCFLPAVRYVRNEQNTGSAGGYYEGIRLAAVNNDAVWLLDDDVALEPQSLQKLVDQLGILERGAKVGAVRSWCAKDCSFSAPRRTHSFAWRGTMITKEAIQAIGLPSKEYFLYGDDAEYALRMVRSGFEIYWVPDSKVMEQRKAGIYMEKARLYYAFRNQVHLGFWYRQWWPLTRTILYAVKVLSMISFSSAGNRKDLLCAVKDGIADGFKAKLGRNQAYVL